ncbi:MAG TPA: hypothetical protein PKZ35_16720 [Gammaproteobacteria bacterium]|nr:hypothetical protein [Planctomycetales bacterium]HPE81636.1 hypothetical protein [Gammaproteobacteria bacterium]
MEWKFWLLSFGCIFLTACVSEPTTVQTNGYKSTSVPATVQTHERVPPGIPDLGDYDDETRRTMELACVLKRSDGPVAYGACLNRQIASLRGSSGIPDLSGYDDETRQTMELACVLKRSDGPVAYGRCLDQQIESLRGSSGVPNLSSHGDETPLTAVDNDAKLLTPDEFCARVAKIAEMAITSRQNGVPLAEVLKKADDLNDPRFRQLLRDFALLAYEQERWHYEGNQRHAIDDFRDQTHITCIRTIEAQE